MFFYNPILALALALAAVAILAVSPRHRRAEGTSAALFYFLLLFPLIWLGGAWLAPVGPPIAGVNWLAFLLVAAFLLLFLFAVATPSAPPRRRGDVTPANAQEEAVAGTVIAFGTFFWLLLVGALAGLALRYW